MKSITAVLFIGLLVVAGPLSPLYAGSGGSTASGAERAVTSDPVFEDHGNRWRPISTRFSTNTLILISSAPENTGLDIAAWRFREIVNTSDGLLTLYPDNLAYTQFSSTYGIVLSSSTDPANPAAGDSWVVPGQGEVYGVWSDSTTKNGAGGSEHFYKKMR